METTEFLHFYIALTYIMCYNILKIILRSDWMDIRVGDILEMKKNHPCGSRSFSVLRIGMDFRLKCVGCGHEMMISRLKAEKNIRKVIRDE